MATESIGLPQLNPTSKVSSVASSPALSGHVWPVYNPTLHPKPNCSAEADAVAIGNMDKEDLVEFLAKHTNAQRQAIAAAHGDLDGIVRSRFHDDCEDLMVQLIQPPAGADAMWIKKAVSGVGIDENLLHEILCTRTNEQIKDIAIAFQDRYGEPLADRLRRECSGKHKHLILEILDGDRATQAANYTESEAKEDAQKIWDAGEARTVGVDEAVFLDIFGRRSWHQIRQIVEEYNKLGARDMTSSIKHQFIKIVDLPSTKKCGNALMTINEFALNPGRFWAKKLHHAASGLSTDEDTIFRIFSSRCEIDLGAASMEYGQLYGKTLRKMVEDEFSGKTRLALLTLLGAPEEKQ